MILRLVGTGTKRRGRSLGGSPATPELGVEHRPPWTPRGMALDFQRGTTLRGGWFLSGFSRDLTQTVIWRSQGLLFPLQQVYSFSVKRRNEKIKMKTSLKVKKKEGTAQQVYSNYPRSRERFKCINIYKATPQVFFSFFMAFWIIIFFNCGFKINLF